ncbi:MAG: hypothetical protein HUU11_08035 [Anaerolineales bacterium]|nr:hypothetical protein [Anaerolineales bacterium]
MHNGKGQVVELILKDGRRQVRISCASDLIPAPGQYLLASDGSDSPLPVSLFSTESSADGFIAAAPIPDSWNPGGELYLRGPLGRGFELPVSARKVALVAFEDSPARLRGLIAPALKQGAAVALVCDLEEDQLPDEVEAHPLSALDEVFAWADYAAFDAARENLPGLRERLVDLNQMSAGKEAQALIHTPIPCGGIAECGVCAVTLRSGWRLACKEGPVFDLWGI